MRRSRRHANDAFRSSETLLGSRIPLMSLIQTLAVAEHLNFRHAANALGVAQSSVSARVKALEQDLGILLFERHARGVRLTEAGRHFVEQIAAGVDQLDHAVKTAGMAAAGEWGRLRIGVHALIPHSFLGYRKFNRPFWRVWRVGSGRASAALGTDRAQIGGSCVGFRHRGATQRLSA